MKNLIKGLVLFITLLVGVSQVSAGEWQIVGPRALGMGGANVAVANDATASYWNPGAFGFFDHPGGGGDYGNRGWSTSLGVGVGAQVLGGLGEQIDKISDVDFNNISSDSISTEKVADLISLINTLKAFDENKDMAANILANGGLRIQSGHFGIGGVVFANITATIVELDLENLGSGETGGVTRTDFVSDISTNCSPCSGTTLTGPEITELEKHLTGLGWTAPEATTIINAVDASLSLPGAPALSIDEIKGATTLVADAADASGGLIDNNTTTLNFKGIAVAEIPLTYGHAFTDDFAVGGNIKYMKARIYDKDIKMLNDETDDEFGDSLDKALDNYEEETNFGIDLGALYRFGDNLRVGLVGRNLNGPTFGSFKEKAQVRAGFAYKPLSFITIAGDADLTKNDTLIPGNFKSQNIGAGLEIRLFKFLMLRGGAYKNIAENDIGLVYTAGLGINLWLLNIDVGASKSEKETDLDGNSFPEEVKGAFAISMLF